jgi:hypothetical protein
MSGNVRGYRTAKLLDEAAPMPGYNRIGGQSWRMDEYPDARPR